MNSRGLLNYSPNCRIVHERIFAESHKYIAQFQIHISFRLIAIISIYRRKDICSRCSNSIICMFHTNPYTSLFKRLYTLMVIMTSNNGIFRCNMKKKNFKINAAIALKKGKKNVSPTRLFSFLAEPNDEN